MKSKYISALVMVADRDDLERAQLKAILKFKGFRVVEAGDGPQAIEIAIAQRPDLLVHDVDVVLDPLGADSHKRSFTVLKKGGILVALLVEPRQDLARESGVRAAMIGVKPDGQRLAEIGKMIDDGKLRPLVQEVLPLEHAKKALELSRSRHVGGEDRLIHLTDHSGALSEDGETQK
jgi:NADPH:quinone reductase-like Zn-dependent oxidoreductase